MVKKYFYYTYIRLNVSLKKKKFKYQSNQQSIAHQIQKEHNQLIVDLFQLNMELNKLVQSKDTVLMLIPFHRMSKILAFASSNT